MQLDVVNSDNKKVGSVDLPDDVFDVEVNETLLWEQVRAQRASQRRGTHATKTRAQVSGGGAKPFKQKGTGRARQGSSRAPNHVGGGTVFGPHPRDYSYRLPRSARKSALRSALSLRAGEGNVVVVDTLPLAAPRTKEVAAFLGRLGTDNVLIVDADNTALKLSTRNLPKADYLVDQAVNVYDILKHGKLVLTQAALAAVIDKARRSEQPAAAVA